MAAHPLFESNRGLAHLAARRVHARFGHMELDDLVQEALLGLLRAARYFDPRQGCTFSTYAYGACHHACLRACRQQRTMAWGSVAAAQICDHREPPPDRQIEAVELWHKVMPHLHGRRREILERRCRGERQIDIALSLGVSRQRIEQYERAALAIARKLAGV